LLNHVWDRRLEGRRFQWPPAISINLALDFPDIEFALGLAPPGTLFLVNGQPPQYGLSLLGVLLTAHGDSYQSMLVLYLGYVCARAKDNPLLPDNKRLEVASSLELTSGDSLTLGHLIHLSGLQGNHMSLGEEWTCGYPEGIARLRFVPSMAEHVANLALEAGQRVVAQLAPMQLATPIDAMTRRPKRGFRFVASSELRRSARTDWREARLAHRGRSWRSCVIGCGAVLEAMLLDGAEKDATAALAAYSQKFVGRALLPLRRWSLNELAEVCVELKILGDQSFHLAHALRFSRDLVHPGRAVRLRASIGKPEADLALATVRHVHVTLAKRWREVTALSKAAEAH